MNILHILTVASALDTQVRVHEIMCVRVNSFV